MVSWGNLADRLEQWAASKYAKLAGRGILSKDDLPIITPKAARYHNNPVLTRGGAGAWDEGRVDNPSVFTTLTTSCTRCGLREETLMITTEEQV